MSPKLRDVTEYKSNIVRLPPEILSKLREIMPELKDESDANLVRVALRKFIYDAQVRGVPSERIDKLLAEARAKTAEAEKARPEWQKQNQ